MWSWRATHSQWACRLLWLTLMVLMGCGLSANSISSDRDMVDFEPAYYEATYRSFRRIEDALAGKGLSMAKNQKFGMLGVFDLCMYGIHNCVLGSRQAARRHPDRAPTINHYLRSIHNVTNAMERTLAQAVKTPTAIEQVRRIADTVVTLLSSCNDLLQPVQPADPLAKIKKISTKVSAETWFTVGAKSKDTPKIVKNLAAHQKALSGYVPSAVRLEDKMNYFSLLTPHPVMEPAYIPLMGFDLSALPDDIKTATAIMWALQAGYRRFVLTQGAPSNQWIANIIQNNAMLSVLDLKRSDIFIHLNLNIDDEVSMSAFTEMSVKEVIEEHLLQLHLDFIDLVTINMVPVGTKAWDRMIGIWNALVELTMHNPNSCYASTHSECQETDMPMISHLGLKDFDVLSLETFMRETRGRPEVLQLNFDIYRQAGLFLHKRSQLLEFCAKHSIYVETYSVASGEPFVLSPVDDDHVQRIAYAASATPTQVLLRWALQLGLGATYSSMSQAEIFKSYDIFHFAIPEHIMDYISGLAWLVSSPVNKPQTKDVYGVNCTDC